MKAARLIALALVLVSSTAWARSARHVSSPARSYFELGRSRYRARDYQGALDAFQRSFAVERVPAMWINIGETLKALGRLDEAKQAYQHFLDGRSGSRKLRAHVFEELDAIESKLHPAAPPITHATPAAVSAFRRGRERYLRGELALALADFEEAYRRTPSPAMLVDLGHTLRKLDRPAEALAAYRTFLDERAGNRKLRVAVFVAYDQLRSELDRRMYSLAEAVLLFDRVARATSDPLLKSGLAVFRREILDTLVQLDDQANGPFDVGPGTATRLAQPATRERVPAG